jgi:hypothetical protein
MSKTFEFNVKVEISGEATEQEVRDFIQFELGTGSISNDNPLIDEDSDAEITFVEVESY